MKELLDILGAVKAWRGDPRDLVLATVARVEGNAYRHPGARLLLGPEGPLCGSISGGCLEGDVEARAREVRADRQPRLVRYDLRSDLDLVWGTGSGCEGLADILVESLGETPFQGWLGDVDAALRARRTLRLATGLGQGADPDLPLGVHRILADREALSEGAEALLERFEPPIALWCLGAGEDAKPLVKLAAAQGWSVGLADHRPAFLTPDRFPGIRLLPGRPEATVPHMNLDSRTACVLLSHQWDRDLEALRLLLPSPVAYIGLLGHRRRGARLLETLAESGFQPAAAELGRLFTPMGLDLGASGPEGIALAVLAEIQAVMAGRHGGHLRERPGPVHG
jgi:xanthine/CO dehydrogenase XdhC/CoxF family maturation factor